MIQLLTDVVLIVTGFQLLVLALMVLARHPRGDVRNILLAFFLVTKGFLVSRWFAYRFDLLDYQATQCFYLVSAAGFFVLAPALYLHVKSLCSGGSPPGKAAVLHFLPAAGVAVAGGLCAAAQLDGGNGVLARAAEDFSQHYWRFFWAVNFAQILAYIVAMFGIVHERRGCFTPVRMGRPKPGFRWLEALLCVIFLHWLFVTSRAVVALFELAGGTFLAVMDLFSITIFLVFTTVLVLRGLSTVRLFPTFEQSRSGFDEDQARECAARIARTMELEKPFLTPSLSIEDLAAMLSVPSWQLSRVINNSFSHNFFNFINGYRIEYAKRELADPLNNQKTMLRILHEAGFNSKSTFNEAFKRHTGITPSEYRRQKQGVVRCAS